MSITTQNPYSEQNIESYPLMKAGEVELVLQKAELANKEWRNLTFEQRGDLFRKAAEILRQNKREYAELMSTEMGKPILSAGAEVDKSAWVCEYFADYADELLAPQLVEMKEKAYVRFDPLGLVLAIMPWNFPFWQVFRCAAPVMMAGNGLLLKHAPSTMGCAVAIEKVFYEAGFPEGIFSNLAIEVNQVKAVIEDERVAAVTLTGSTRAGKAVAAQAGAALKKTVLELGGSDPYIVLKDADIENATQACVAARMNNAGQTCVAAKRLIVEESVYDEFINKLKQQMQTYVMGNPLDPKTTLGPLARKDLQENIHRQVTESIEQGADCILGGELPDGTGFFYPPTILTNVKPGMVAACEELFGPVAVVFKVKNEAEAIELANQTEYGLGAAVFCKDAKYGEEVAAKLNAGNVAVNTFVKSDARLPFGGIKNSGYGREMGSQGIHEFVNVKSVIVAS
jgi:succinate-semialdehyde dehydrogenase / glutarate-semialdehyde dehydrogenase